MFVYVNLTNSGPEEQFALDILTHPTLLAVVFFPPPRLPDAEILPPDFFRGSRHAYQLPIRGSAPNRVPASGNAVSVWHTVCRLLADCGLHLHRKLAAAVYRNSTVTVTPITRYRP